MFTTFSSKFTNKLNNIITLGSELLDTEISAFLSDTEERKQTVKEIVYVYHILTLILLGGGANNTMAP